MMRDVFNMNNEEAKTNPKVLAISEEEFEKILDQMYEELPEDDDEGPDDEAMEEWFEKKFEEISKMKMNRELPVIRKENPLERD